MKVAILVVAVAASCLIEASSFALADTESPKVYHADFSEDLEFSGHVSSFHRWQSPVPARPVRSIARCGGRSAIVTANGAAA